MKEISPVAGGVIVTVVLPAVGPLFGLMLQEPDPLVKEESVVL